MKLLVENRTNMQDALCLSGCNPSHAALNHARLVEDLLFEFYVEDVLLGS